MQVLLAKYNQLITNLLQIINQHRQQSSVSLELYDVFKTICSPQLYNHF